MFLDGLEYQPTILAEYLVTSQTIRNEKGFHRLWPITLSIVSPKNANPSKTKRTEGYNAHRKGLVLRV